MSVFEQFFHKLFGRRNNHEPPTKGFEDHRQYGDRFRNPIWQTDDDDDDEAGEFSRQPAGSSVMHFNIFSDPVEITRYFESQMDGMLKNFFHGFGQGFGVAIEPYEDGTFSALSPSENQSGRNLRDNVLKPGYEYPSAQSSGTPKLDIDLDGKIGADDVIREWKEPGSLVSAQPSSARPEISFRSFGKSISSQVIRRPDGSMEQRQTITDSEGNTETTVTRQIGDKTHTIKMTRDHNGVETKTEDLINIDQNRLQEFDNKWQPVVEPPVEPGTLNPFPWEKYFSFNPKL